MGKNQHRGFAIITSLKPKRRALFGAQNRAGKRLWWAGLLHHEMLHRVEKSALFGRTILFADVVRARLWWIRTTARSPPSQQTKSRRSNGSILNFLGITDPGKLDLWLAIIALTMSWTYRCASKTIGLSPIRKKSHGYKEKSWFRTGLDQLRRWIIHQPQKAARVWMKLWPKKKSTLKSAGVV